MLIIIRKLIERQWFDLPKKLLMLELYLRTAVAEDFNLVSHLSFIFFKEE